jgi:hypothetical protein
MIRNKVINHHRQTKILTCEHEFSFSLARNPIRRNARGLMQKPARTNKVSPAVAAQRNRRKINSRRKTR